MNEVVLRTDVEPENQSAVISDIIGKNFDARLTAFVGRCGDGPVNQLYLVTPTCVFLASNPIVSWTPDEDPMFCPTMTIKEWVDIVIMVKDKTELED